MAETVPASQNPDERPADCDPVAPGETSADGAAPGGAALPEIAGGGNGALSREQLKEKTFDGVRWFAVTRGGAEAISILAAVALARLVSPADFGRLAVAVIASEFALCIANETVGAPLVQRPTLDREHLESAALIGLVIGIVLGALTLFVLPLLTTPVFGARTTTLFRLFSPAFLLAGLMIVPLAKLQRHLQFRQVAVVEIAGVVVSAAVSVGLALLGLGARAYVLGVIAGLLVQTVGYFRGQPITRPRWHPRHARDLFGFGIPASAAGLASVSYRNVDYMILGARLPSLTVGYYYRAFTLGVEYERRLSGIIARLALPVFSRAESSEHLRALRLRIVRVNVAVVYPMLALFIAVAPQVIPWLFGARWQPAVVPAQILAIAGMASTVRSITGPSVLAAGRPRAMLVFSLGETVLYGATVWIASSHGLVAICIAVSVFQIAAIVIAYLVLMRHTVGLSLAQLFGDVGPAIVCCLPLAAVVLAIEAGLPASTPVLVELLLVCPAGCAAYLLAARWLFGAMWADLALLGERVLPRRLVSLVSGGRGSGGVPSRDATAAAGATPTKSMP